MLNTFEALAKFSTGENSESDSGNQQNNDSGINAAVDISAVINRLNEIETKVNQILNRETDFPARGKNDENTNEITESEGNDNADNTNC